MSTEIANVNERAGRLLDPPCATRYLRQCSLGRDARAANKIGKTRIATNAVEVRVDVHFVRVHLRAGARRRPSAASARRHDQTWQTYASSLGESRIAGLRDLCCARFSRYDVPLRFLVIFEYEELIP